jgi:2-polyprenyl-3-methyl-5-hydroxy-6-metoxy-1,4-benzoquinol methylase
MSCEICFSENFKKVLDLYDDRYGYPGKFDLYECLHCGHKFLDNNFTSEQLGDLYSNYYPRSSFSIENYQPLKFKNNFLSWFNGERRSAFTYIPKGVKVLDVGCGFGQSLKYHQDRGCDAYGVEADSNIQKVIDEFGFNIKVGLFNQDDYKKNFFEYITMDQVLEHTVDPIKTLQGASKILKPNGRIIISIPNSNGWGAKVFGRKWINWHTPYHLQHFSKRSIKIAAKKSGLEVESLKTITSSEWLHYQWLHIASFPKLGEPSFFWSPSQDSRIGIKIVFFVIHKLKINHFITRFFDACNVGDSYIIFLKKNDA